MTQYSQICVLIIMPFLYPLHCKSNKMYTLSQGKWSIFRYVHDNLNEYFDFLYGDLTLHDWASLFLMDVGLHCSVC